MKNLESFGVHSLNSKSHTEIDGGSLAPTSTLSSAIESTFSFTHAAIDFTSGAWERFNMFRN